MMMAIGSRATSAPQSGMTNCDRTSRIQFQISNIGVGQPVTTRRARSRAHSPRVPTAST